MMTTKDLGKLFKDAREQKKLSIEDASGKTRIHTNVLADIENGAIGRLSAVYMRSFIKKYASFLGMDTDKTIVKFAPFFDARTEKNQEMTKETGRDEALFNEDFFKKENEAAPAASEAAERGRSDIVKFIVIAAVVAFAAVAALRICRSFRADEPKGTAAPAEKQAQGAEKAAPESAPQAAEKPKEAQTPFSLTLKAKGNVWVQILSKGKTVFTGVLSKGETKTITSKDPLTVWTGKGEYLDFTVGARKMGRIAEGVVKNIEVSKEGIKVGGKIVKRLDR